MIPARERRSFWVAVLVLCAIAIAVSIRRLVALAGPIPLGNSYSDELDAVFAAKRTLTAGHVLVGLVLALAIPIRIFSPDSQSVSARASMARPVLLLVGLMVGVSAFGMMARPVGGWLEAKRYGFLRLGVPGGACDRVVAHQDRDVTRHREWMLRERHRARHGDDVARDGDLLRHQPADVAAALRVFWRRDVDWVYLNRWLLKCTSAERD